MKKRRLVFLLGFILLSLLLGILLIEMIGKSSSQHTSVVTNVNYYATAESRIKIGDDRQQVVQAMSDAWYHCVSDQSQAPPSYRGYTDYFFYGSKEFDQATVLILSSKITEKQEIVLERVGTFENYLWCVALSCMPPEFQDSCDESNLVE